MILFELWNVKEAPHHEESNRPDGEVEEEHPTPSRNSDDICAPSEESSDERAEDTGCAEDGNEQPLVSRAFARGNDVGNDREREGHEPTSTEALNSPECRKFNHRCCETGE